MSMVGICMSIPRFCYRIAIVRYKPRWLYAIYLIVIQPTVVTIFFFYVYYCALHDVLWGSAVFICTARSVSSSQIFTKEREESALKESGKDADPEAGLLKPPAAGGNAAANMPPRYGGTEPGTDSTESSQQGDLSRPLLS